MISSSDGTTIYTVATDLNGGTPGIYKSVNGGDDWEMVNNGITDFSFQDVFVVDPNKAYVCTDMGNVFATTDGGANWSLIGDLFSVAGSLATIHVLDTTIYVGGQGMQKTNNGGISWDTVMGPWSGGFFTDILQINPTTIYAANSMDSIYKSSDGGINWTNINFGVPTNSVYNEFSAVDANTVFLGMNGGVYKTTDGGTSWAAFNNGLTNTNVNTVAAVNADTIFVGINGSNALFKSVDGGANWNPSSIGLPSSGVSCLLVKGSNDIIVGTGGDGVYCSYSGVVLATQTDVDNFGTNYGNPTTFGTLIISDDNNGIDNILNLNGLLSLTSVNNLIITGNDNLPNLSGLDALALTQNDLLISNNALLMDVIALGTNSLVTVGGTFEISNNPVLANLDGLSELTSIGENLIIEQNAVISNVDGIINLSSIGGDLEIRENSNLSSCQGIGQLVEESGMAINGDIMIEENMEGCNDLDEVIASLVPIPTLSQWSVIILGFIMLIMGLTYVKAQKQSLA